MVFSTGEMTASLYSFLDSNRDFLLSFDFLSFLAFLVILSVLLYRNKSRLHVQKLVSYLLYVVLWRTSFGLRFMESFSKRHGRLVRGFGYFCVFIGFLGLVVISFNILYLIFNLIVIPEVKQEGVALVLPFVNVPGIGYLSFWHWIISIFILALIHEFSHGIVANAHGIKVKSSGFGVFGVLAPVLPVAFVEPDEEDLKTRKDMVQYSVFAAGPGMNILFSLLVLALIVFVLAPAEGDITYPVGFSARLLNESYPASVAGMKDRMVISGINSRNVDDFSQFVAEMEDVRPFQEITIEADNITYNITTTEHPENKSRGFIGITPLYNERHFKPEYVDISPYFSWFRDFFKWLFLLNLFIGLANLMPLGIVDGGRMLQILSLRIFKNRETALSVWSFVSILFIVFLLLALFTTYIGNPFVFLK